VLALAAERRPHLVVVSGDLTQRARPEQFRAERAFVDSLPAPAIVVPGNHDVPLYRFWERIFDPFGAYRRHFAAELEPIFADEELLVVGSTPPSAGRSRTEEFYPKGRPPVVILHSGTTTSNRVAAPASARRTPATGSRSTARR
jgi:predicted MPP superfamily phosphohydrolase